MSDKPVSLTAVVMPTSQDVVEYVAKNPFAIGYVIKRLCGGTGAAVPIRAGGDDVPHAAELHPLCESRPWTACCRRMRPSATGVTPRSSPCSWSRSTARQGWNRQFIDFALSPAGQAIVDRYHVPVR